MNQRIKKKRKKRYLQKNFDKIVYQAIDELVREDSKRELQYYVNRDKI